MLNNYGYRHTLSICNTYCIFYGNNGYSKAPQGYVYIYIACLVYPPADLAENTKNVKIVTSAYSRIEGLIHRFAGHTQFLRHETGTSVF